MSKIKSKDLVVYINKYWQYILLFLIILAVISMRANVSEAPATKVWAENTINQNILNDITTKVNSQYPNLPEASKQSIIQQQFLESKDDNKEQIELAKEQLSEQYKELISYEYKGNRYIYLGDIDSYFWLRFARNIEEKGNYCDEIKNGRCVDNKALAPLGTTYNKALHPYVIYFVHKVSNFIGYDIPLMQASLITPLIIAVLTAVAAYFAGLMLYGKLAGIVASVLISFNVMYVSRSIGSDNDVYNLLFPLIILAFLFMAIRSKKHKNLIIGSSLAGLFTGLFNFAWPGGWTNIFNAIMYSSILYLGFLFVHDYWNTKSLKSAIGSKLFKKILSILGLYWLGGVFGSLITSLITGNVVIKEYLLALFQPVNFIKFAKSAVNLNVWPNVLTTVAEFNALPLVNVPKQVFGGSPQTTLLYFLAILGIVLLITASIMKNKNKWFFISYSIFLGLMFTVEKTLGLSPLFYLISLTFLTLLPLLYVTYKKQNITLEKEHNLYAGILLLVWFVGTVLATTKGIRFALLVAPVVGLSIAIMLNILYETISKWISSQYDIKTSNIIKVILIVVLLILPLSTTKNAFSVSENYIPSYNAAWDSALLKINQESGEDAIVNSWWDFGHWFKYTTDRGVTLDGATQNAPALHWLGKLLLTNNETVSRGILRMLDCGSNNAYEVVYNTTKDIPVSVDIVNQIIVLDNKEEVKSILSSYGMNETDQEKTLEYSHCDAPENYLITSDDMVGKGGVWAHFGSWNFYRAEIAQMKLSGYSKQEIIENLTSRELRNTTNDEVEDLYLELGKQRNDNQINAWIADWPSFMGTTACSQNIDMITCQNGIVINTTSKEGFFVNNNQLAYPSKFMYIGEKGIFEKEYTENLASVNNNKIGFMVMQTDASNPNSLIGSIMHPDLVGSMFTRLYYTQGQGLRYFDEFDHKTSPLGTNIYTWKSDWEGESYIDLYDESTSTIIE